MKLQRQHPVAEPERLVFAAPAARQMHGAVRNREGIAVPMQYRRPVIEQGADRIAPPGVGALHREPADLRLRVGGHRRAQHAGDQLRAETHPQHLFVRRDALFDKTLFRRHPRVAGFVVGAHGAAHHDQGVQLLRFGKRFALVKAGGGQSRAALRQPGFHGAELFERHMGQIVNAHQNRYSACRIASACSPSPYSVRRCPWISNRCVRSRASVKACA